MKGKCDKIRVGIVSKDKVLRTALISSFKKYSSAIEIVFEKNSEAELVAKDIAAKVKSSRISALFISSDADTLQEIKQEITEDVLSHTRIFVLVENSLDTLSEKSIEAADSVVMKDADHFVTCTRLCTLCDDAFISQWEKDRRLLKSMAENLLVETGFDYSLMGSAYLAEAMVMSVYNEDYLGCLSALYFAIAHEMEATSEMAVEKCVRSAVDKAYKRFLKNEESLQKVQCLSKELFTEGKPTNGTVLFILVKNLKKSFTEKKTGEKR